MMSDPIEHSLVDPVGQTHQLHIWPVAGDHPAPLLLLLDGDWLGADIQHISSAINRQQVHIATLGYGLNHAETAAQRAFDFSPKAPGREQVDPRVASWQCGGADAFSAFLANSVIGYLRSELNVEQQKTGIFGHSYGGLYCLYALLTQPALFDFYYAASPALWWHWPLIPELVSKSPPQLETKYLQIMAGENEQWHAKAAAPGQIRSGGSPTLPLIKKFMTALQEVQHFSADLQLFAAQTHGPMLHLSARHAIYDFSERTTFQ